MAKSEPLAPTEHAAQIIGQLLRQWSAKDAPVSAQIAFCEELKRAAEAHQTDPEYGWWFATLYDAAHDNLLTLQRLKEIISKAENVKERLDGLASQPPPGLGQAFHGA